MPFMYCNIGSKDYESSHLLDIWLKNENKEKVLEYCKSKLGTLCQMDQEQKTEYIKTLKVYFQNNRSIQKTSETLFIHRNTVTQRIRKVFELLGVDPNDFAEVNELYNMIQIIEYYEKEV